MKNEVIRKYQVVSLLRDAKWQINSMKQQVFPKHEVLEMLDDLINEVCKEE